jgi:acetyl-CoA carboxylase carboxyl transferase subunit alpha
MAQLRTPILCTIIGEGGSGGALAIGIGDRVLMLKYSTYSVISPEGCASILWKSADKAAEAAEAMNITSLQLKKLKLIDDIIDEPLGGAHRDVSQMTENVKAALLKGLQELDALTLEELLEQRYQRLLGYGQFKTS